MDVYENQEVMKAKLEKALILLVLRESKPPATPQNKGFAIALEAGLVFHGAPN